MWIDAGFCARALHQPLRLNFFRVRQERLLVFIIRYHFAGGQDMHGFTTDGYHTLSGSKPWMHARGNIFSGNAAAIEAGARAYERSLEDSLAHGFMGTEESALTLAIMRSPTLFHVTPLFVALSFTLQSSIDAFNFFLFAPDADNQQRLRRSRASMSHVPHAVASPR